MSDAPERRTISKCGKTIVHEGWKRFDTDVEYIRADLCDPLSDPRVAALVDELDKVKLALEFMAAADDDAGQMARRPLRILAKALAALRHPE